MTLDEAIKQEEELVNMYQWGSGDITQIQQHKQFAEWLKELKHLREQSTLIPVSKRLPKDREWCLGIFKEPDTGWINPIPYICDYVGKATKATTKEYWILHGFTDMDEHIDYYFNLECVAWMPLSTLYKESEDKNEN